MKEAIIYSEITPNPATLKFRLDRDIVDKTYDYLTLKDAEKESPLATRIFLIPDVSGVYLGRNFVTVSKNSTKHWDDYEDNIIQAIREHLKAGDPVVHKTAETKEKKELSEAEQKISKVLEDEIRPAVAMDGGDIILKGYEDGIVYLQMLGSCSGCPSSTATLKQGIEVRLKELMPEIKEVVSV